MESFDQSQLLAFFLAVTVYLAGVFLIANYEPKLGSKKKYADVVLLAVLILILVLGGVISGDL